MNTLYMSHDHLRVCVCLCETRLSLPTIPFCMTHASYLPLARLEMYPSQTDMFILFVVLFFPLQIRLVQFVYFLYISYTCFLLFVDALNLHENRI